MTRWEYKIIKGANWNHQELRDGLIAELNTQGNSGWELVAVVGEYFYFKREITKQPVVIEHALDCPVSRSNHTGIEYCNCDFMQRLKAVLT